MILLVLMLLPGSFDVTRDVSVDFLVDNPLVEDEYVEVWQITNLDHVSGQTDSLDVFVKWSFENISSNYTKTLNRFTKSGGPTLNISNENTLCVNVTPLNFYDPNLDNNYLCKTFLTEIEVEEPNYCSCELEVFAQNYVERQGDAFKYGFDFCSSPYPLQVSYWIEDVRGNVVRNVVSTTSNALKSFTPSFDELEKSFVVYARVDECDLQKNMVLTSYNSIPSPYLEVRIPGTANFGSVFSAEISGIKDSSKRVLEVFVEKDGVKFSEVSKVYVDDFKFSFIIPVVLFDKDSSYNDMYKLVVSGLDFYHEERIYLMGEEKEEERFELIPSFNSFYTRKQVFDGNLTVHYSVENVFSGELLVITSEGVFSDFITTRTGSLDVEIGFANEVILGLLHDANGVVVDQRFIQLNLSLKDEEEMIFESPILITAEPKEGRFKRIFNKIFRI